MHVLPKSKMGFKTIAISRRKDKEEPIRKLGATQYIDSKSQNSVEELVKLGGAKVILGTVSRKGNDCSIGWSGNQRKTNHDWCI